MTIDSEVVKFNLKVEDYDDLDDTLCTLYKQSEDELKWYSLLQAIDIFEKLVIFLYNGAIAIGHKEFQREIKALITEFVNIYEKGVEMMQHYKTLFCSILKNGKFERELKNIYHVFYERFDDLTQIYMQISDFHEKLTELQKALAEAVELKQYNISVILKLQTTVDCCIEGIELICECSRKCLQKRLEKPVHKGKKLDLTMDIWWISFIFVAIERCQTLIEISECTIQNIKEETQKTITVDMAKATVRKTIATIPSLTSLFDYHHKTYFCKMSVFYYFNK